MTDYEAKKVILKNSSGEYLIPYTEADATIDNLDSTYLPLAGNSYSTNPITGSIHMANSTGGNRKIINYDPNFDSTGTTPNPNGTSSTYYLIDCSASAAGTGKGLLGCYQLYMDTSGVMTSQIAAINYIGGTSYTCAVQAKVDSSGTCYTQAPTPSNNDDSTKIATTAFVSNMLTSSNSNFITFSKSSSGYYKFANGLKISWMYVSFSSGTTSTFTLPVSYSSSSSYCVACADTGSDRVSYAFSRTSASTITGYAKVTTNDCHVIAVGY